jgi:hypothetical protein
MAADLTRRPLTERFVERAAFALDRRTDRRSVLQAAAVVGSRNPAAPSCRGSGGSPQRSSRTKVKMARWVAPSVPSMASSHSLR